MMLHMRAISRKQIDLLLVGRHDKNLFFENKKIYVHVISVYENLS